MKWLNVQTKALSVRKISFITLLLSTMLTLMGCGGTDKIDTSKLEVDVWLKGRAEQDLAQLQDELKRVDNIENSIVLVDVPKHKYRWHSVHGIANSRTNLTLQKGDNFRTGSITKLLTAIRVLQLYEQGLLALDQTLDEILNDSDIPADWRVTDLSVYQGQSMASAITVRQLLQHTAGLHDYLFEQSPTGTSLFWAILDDATGAVPSGMASKQWSAEALLLYYFSSGMGQVPTSQPGDAFNYTDTHYMLLAVIIEKLTGMSLAENYRLGIFSKANMTDAYLEWYEPPQSAPPVDHFIDTRQIRSDGSNINIVAKAINTSADWGGGGVVSNAEGLKNLLSALFNDELFNDPNTLTQMMTFVPIMEAEHSTKDVHLTEYNYGLGLIERVYSLPNKRKVKIYGHSGFYGHWAFYEPKTKTSIVIALNQSATTSDWLDRIVEILDNAQLFGLSL